MVYLKVENKGMSPFNFLTVVNVNDFVEATNAFGQRFYLQDYLKFGIIVFCLISMSFSAYAYFSHNISSEGNLIKSSNFETNITLQIVDSGGTVKETVKPITSNYKTFKISDLKAWEWYTITITPTEKSTANTGFIVVSANGGNKIYHTQQLGDDEYVEGGKTTSVTFELMITDTTDVILEARWGTSVYYNDYINKTNELYITQNDEIKMVVNGVENPQEKDDGESQSDSIPVDTNSEVNESTETNSEEVSVTESSEEESVSSQDTSTEEPLTSIESSVVEQTPESTE